MNIPSTDAAETKIPVDDFDGYQIGPNDYGRPVSLIAAALGVKPDVFRKAFSGVTPARGRGPSRDEAQKNKAALLKVLGPQGVTNERLDKVSSYYRFRPQNGELWPTTEAKAHVIIENGKIKRIAVTDPGSGYCSPPEATVPGFEKTALNVTLKFASDLEKNGGVAAIRITSAKPRAGKTGN